MKKAYFLSTFIWRLLSLAVYGKETEEGSRYHELRRESEHLKEIEKKPVSAVIAILPGQTCAPYLGSIKHKALYLRVVSGGRYRALFCSLHGISA